MVVQSSSGLTGCMVGKAAEMHWMQAAGRRGDVGDGCVPGGCEFADRPQSGFALLQEQTQG